MTMRSVNLASAWCERHSATVAGGGARRTACRSGARRWPRGSFVAGQLAGRSLYCLRAAAFSGARLCAVWLGTGGVNLGPTAHLLRGALNRLAELSQLHGPVSVVGFSMGGLFARWLAQREPAQVRRVITVCSPFSDPARSLFVSLDRVLHLWPGVDLRSLAEEVGRPLTVPGSFRSAAMTASSPGSIAATSRQARRISRSPAHTC